MRGDHLKFSSYRYSASKGSVIQWSKTWRIDVHSPHPPN